MIIVRKRLEILQAWDVFMKMGKLWYRVEENGKSKDFQKKVIGSQQEKLMFILGSKRYASHDRWMMLELKPKLDIVDG